MGIFKVWALLVIGLVISGWIRGKHFLAFSTAGFVGLGGLIALERANEAAQPSNSIFTAGLFVAAAFATLIFVATHFKNS